MTYRAGDASSSSGWLEAMETVLSRLPKGISIFLNRADVSFASEESLSGLLAPPDSENLAVN
jgi:hypothetical protein